MSKKATTKPDDDKTEDQQPDELVEAVADWLAEDYAGPLDAVQAAARLKRHGHHVTKPAAEAVTK